MLAANEAVASHLETAGVPPRFIEFTIVPTPMLPKVRAERPDVAVIMITAYGDAETRRKAIERGAVGLLTKPIDFALLRHEIDARLGQAA